MSFSRLISVGCENLPPSEPPLSNMDPIQQVLLSVKAETENWRADTLAATDSVHAVDLKELEDWFSEEMLDSTFRFEATNLFFHPLPSGRFTIGRMIPRQGSVFSYLKHQRSFFVQHLVVTPETLLRFANNPIALFQRVHALGGVPLFNVPPRKLRPFQIPEPSPPLPLVDERLLTGLIQNPGTKAVAILLQTALDSVCTFFTGGPSTMRMISGLLQLLPLSWRTELTFSTELHFSRSRPLKLVGINGGAKMFQLNSPDLGISFCDLAAIKRTGLDLLPHLDSWPRLIFQTLERGGLPFLEKKFREEFQSSRKKASADLIPGTDPEELRALAAQWSSEFWPGSRKGVTRKLPSQIETTEPVIFSFPNLEPVDSVLERQPDSENEKSLEKYLAASLNDDFAPDSFEAASLEAETLKREVPENPEPSELEPVPIATLIQQKVIRLNDSPSPSLARRIKRFPQHKDELKWLDSCAARILLGDRSALPSFQLCWKKIVAAVDPLQKMELTEEYLVLLRDFVGQSVSQNDSRILDRDINVLELLEALLSSK